ncbi:MAG: EF-hand domain-containing protein [Fuerstiella sp.]
MKNFTFVILAVAIVGALSATAQPPGGGRGRPGGGGFGGPPQGGPQGGPPPNAVLAAIDADGDHEISAQEIAESPRSLAKLDKNRDGKLTHDEIHGGGPGGGGPGGGGRPTAEQFLTHAMTFDVDGDGMISKAEMANMAKAVTEEMARRGGGERGPGGAGGSGGGRSGRQGAEGSGQSRQRPEIE